LLPTVRDLPDPLIVAPTRKSDKGVASEGIVSTRPVVTSLDRVTDIRFIEVPAHSPYARAWMRCA